MTFPAIILGFVIASLIGSLFHLWRGGGLLRLILYIVFSWTGFWLGQYVAARYSITFWSVGSLHVGMGVIVCLCVLGFFYWLSLIQNADLDADKKSRYS